MSRKPYDPLAMIPSPEVIRERLSETLTLAGRLQLLLDFAERLQLPLVRAAELPLPEKAKGASRG